MAMDKTIPEKKQSVYGQASELIRNRDSFTLGVVETYTEALDSDEEFDSQQCVEAIEIMAMMNFANENE